MGGPYDPAIHSEYIDSKTNSALVAEWKKYADTCQKHGTPAIAQICHPGRQSFRVSGYRGIFAQTLAPSAIPMKVGDSYLESLIGYLVWSKPKEMTTQDIERVIRQFVDTARLMADAGFSGIELHGAHGYLIGMFLYCFWMVDLMIFVLMVRLFRPIPQQQGMTLSAPHQTSNTIIQTNTNSNPRQTSAQMPTAAHPKSARASS